MTSAEKGAQDLLAPVRLGPVRLRNRVIKAATYERAARRGRVTDRLVDFHAEVARGGVGMTTVAYCAVAPEGRTDGHQLLWEESAREGLERLTAAVHAEGAAIAAQIGHAGPVADPRATGRRSLAPSRTFNPQSAAFAAPATLADLDRVVRAHAAAALMALETGFDAVEVHLGHNYLVSAFLSPRLNRRKDAHGGALENRARLAREVLGAVHEAVGGRLAVLAKLNMEDGVRGGLWLDESLQVARWIEEDGTVDALVLTAGSSLLNPMYLFRGQAPVDAFAAALPQPFSSAARMGGRVLLRDYPYRDLYLLDHARQFRRELRLPLVLLGGLNGLDHVGTAVDAGFEFVAMARALLREPDLVNRWGRPEGASTASGCLHCNRCMATIYSGTRCVLRPGEN